MRLITESVALTLAGVLLAGAPHAGAAPRSCRIVTDPAGDSQYGHVPSLDLVSFDVASNATHVTVVFRVAELRSFEELSASGIAYSVDFSAGQKRFHVDAARTPDGELYSLWLETNKEGGGRLGVVDGIFDEDLGEIRVHAPVGMFRPYADFRSSRTTVSKFRVTSYRSVGNSGLTEPGRNYARTGKSHDAAESNTATYRAGSPSCVIVGQ